MFVRILSHSSFHTHFTVRQMIQVMHLQRVGVLEFESWACKCMKKSEAFFSLKNRIMTMTNPLLICKKVV